MNSANKSKRGKRACGLPSFFYPSMLGELGWAELRIIETMPTYFISEVIRASDEKVIGARRSVYRRDLLYWHARREDIADIETGTEFTLRTEAVKDAFKPYVYAWKRPSADA